MKPFQKIVGIALALGLAALPLRASAADSGTTTVFAAASLVDVLPVIEKQYEASGGGKVVFSFAASGTLARQIESSAGAHMFISADNTWMDYLDSRGFVQSDSRKVIVGNHLVLVAPKDSNAKITIAPHFALAQALNGGRLAIGDPDSVPAGTYARTALNALGVWNSVVDRLVNGESVRVVLEYVARGEAPLGIVYTTDAMAEPRVKIVADFPESSHPPIVYPAALTRDAKPDAAKFLAYLSGPQARAAFEKAGFVVMGGR